VIKTTKDCSVKIMMTSAEIRQKFLDFFRSRGHVIVPSSPIVVKNDPTLLFTNAGMNQFKDYFLGNKKAPYPRVADTQKCLRVSGKHNDLEEVGVDTYHHTMFEMLGNWSFGDPDSPAGGYFKKEALAWSWELLTEVYAIPQNRLYVTVFEGDAKEGLPKDDEAFTEWKKWIPEDRILMGSKNDNFWEMGDTGPCGPCSEIHVDCRTDEDRKTVDGKTLVNKDHPQVIEIWNNVFIEFDRLKDGSLKPLPAKHVDTGMGLERLVRVLQGKTSNYDTDVFSGTINAAEIITGKKYLATDSKQDIAFRVIADHCRAIAFTIADGQLPSNTGAGYVIRRILRRALRYYYSYLDYKEPMLFQLLPVLAAQFEDVFPELKKQLDFVSKVVKEEEEAFLRTLANGIIRFEKYVSELLIKKGTEPQRINPKESEQRDSLEFATLLVDGDFAFELFDTYGFPIDLTELMAREKGMKVDVEGFGKAMQQQRTRSRAASMLDTEDWIILDEHALSEFVGYDSLEVKSKITKYRKVKSKGKEGYQLMLSATPFYAEGGGQVGDTGDLYLNSKKIVITDTKKDNNLIIHFADTLPDDPSGELIAKVNPVKRKATEVHHTATHLLHAALRTVLGKHVEQKGSLVNDEHLRFDFSHFAKLTEEELRKVEAMVNEKIRENIPVMIKEMPKDEALKLGAMALFGEKYGDLVRVVIVDPAYSIELCGGTHVGSTGELGFFMIKQEAAVAAGVRRVEAVSGKAAEDFIIGQSELILAIRAALKHPSDIQKAVENLMTENGELNKKMESLEAKRLISIRNELLQKIIPVKGTQFLGQIIDIDHAEALKKLCFDLKNELKNFVVVLAANINGKAAVAILLDEGIASAKNLDASKIIKEKIAPLIKGGGGGQKTLATAGGQDASNLLLVIEEIKNLL
jgi:alanyl-tRNA synthetase